MADQIPLVQVATNSGLESNGKTKFLLWEIEGYWFALPGAGILFGITLFILLIQKEGIIAGAIGLITPITLSIVYIQVFVKGRPPHYTEDLLERALSGTTWPKKIPRDKSFPISLGDQHR